MLLTPRTLCRAALLLLLSTAHASPLAPLPRSPALLLPLLPRDPQSTCLPNSGTGNSGCNNSGVSNSGTGNSGICLSGVNESGVGVCSPDDPAAQAVATTTFILASPTTVYVVQTVTLSGASVVTTVQSVFAAGATATQTVVVADTRYNRPGCAYWRTQGYTCNDAPAGSLERWLFWPVVVAAMGAAVVL